ncbi:MAG: response regulator [Aggregatilineales bacterium]
MTRDLLIVEDDKDLGALFKEIIEERGHFNVTLIEDGQVALDYLKSQSVDAVLLDLHLPHVSGLTILDFIRTTPHLSSTPVVVASADDTALKLAEEQADRVVMKPINFHHLDDIINFFMK